MTSMLSTRRCKPGWRRKVRLRPVFCLCSSPMTFLTSGGGCCIGGYHSANGAQPSGQTYSHATYVDSPGSFSQDVSALSHEIGERDVARIIKNHVHWKNNSLMAS